MKRHPGSAAICASQSRPITYRFDLGCYWWYRSATEILADSLRTVQPVRGERRSSFSELNFRSPFTVRGASGPFDPDDSMSRWTVRGASGRFFPDERMSDCTVRGASDAFASDDCMSRTTVAWFAPTTGAIARDDKQRPPQTSQGPGRAHDVSESSVLPEQFQARGPHSRRRFSYGRVGPQDRKSVV